MAGEEQGNKLMKSEGWERIYRERGDLQFGVLSKIKRAAGAFREKNYEKVLDLGCGTGRHALFLASQGFQVYATDLSETGIKIARRKAKSLGLSIHFKQHDMREIPFADNFFDAVICIWTIYHGTLADIQKTVSEVYRVLKVNGTFHTDMLSVDHLKFVETYGLGDEIEKNTFVGEKEGEEDVPHHYTTREEIAQIFLEFRQLKVRLPVSYYTGDRGERHIVKRFDITAIK